MIPEVAPAEAFPARRILNDSNSHIKILNWLTWIFDCGDHQLEAVRVRSPIVRDVFQRHVVGARKHGAQGLFRVFARQIKLKQKNENT